MQGNAQIIAHDVIDFCLRTYEYEDGKLLDSNHIKTKENLVLFTYKEGQESDILICNNSLSIYSNQSVFQLSLQSEIFTPHLFEPNTQERPRAQFYLPDDSTKTLVPKDYQFISSDLFPVFVTMEKKKDELGVNYLLDNRIFTESFIRVKLCGDHFSIDDKCFDHKYHSFEDYIINITQNFYKDIHWIDNFHWKDMRFMLGKHDEKRYLFSSIPQFDTFVREFVWENKTKRSGFMTKDHIQDFINPIKIPFKRDTELPVFDMESFSAIEHLFTLENSNKEACINYILHDYNTKNVLCSEEPIKKIQIGLTKDEIFHIFYLTENKSLNHRVVSEQSLLK